MLTILAAIGSTGLLGALGCLILLWQRDSARQDAASQKGRADAAETALAALTARYSDEIGRREVVEASLRADAAQARKDRDALAALNPDAAGDLLARVLGTPAADPTAPDTVRSTGAPGAGTDPPGKG